MTTTKVLASKLTIALVAAAMVASVFAPVAQAQTTEELQAMINDLLAQVAALQGSTGASASSASVCPYTWTRSLTAGAEGADVKTLQQFLNADADTRVAATGAGSTGLETSFFGPATAAAVSKFQVKYRADVLSPANLVNPTGYFGPSTMAKANALCATAATSTEDGEDTDGEDTESTDLSGEADLDTFEIADADDSTIEEGAEDAQVAEVTVNFTDGDASISRLDLAFTLSGGNPWDAFDTISLWVDGDKVAEADASSKGDYLGDEQDGIVRFSGLDIVGMEDEDVVITVAATIQGNLDNTELGDWNVDGVSMRYFDADGVASTEAATPVTDDTATFTIQTAGTDDEILVKSSSNDPDAATLQVEDNKKSDWYTVFVFDLDTKDSISDITLNNILVDVTMSSGTYDLFVDDAELVIDGTTIDSSPADVTNGASTTAPATINFDVDGDVTIDAGEKVAAELRVRFKSLSNTGNEGVTITATTDADDIDAEGSDDLSTSQLSGVATSDAHTLRTTGIDTTKTDDSAVVTTGDNAGDDYATFEIEVEVTAFEQDVYISTNVATSVSYSIVDGAGSPVTGTTTPVLSSSADENGGYFEITEGETETITLQVTFDATTAGAAARLVLNSISFAETAVTPDQTQTTLPATDYRTSIVTLVN